MGKKKFVHSQKAKKKILTKQKLPNPPLKNKMVHPLQVNIYHEVSVTSTFTESDRR